MPLSAGPCSVSIVIAAFNVAELIENCLLSVIAQTHPDIEIIVVDGGSTDGTTGVLERYTDRVKWSSGRDNGLSDAQWKGVMRATCEWILFLGADDVLASPKALASLFRQCPADLSGIDILTGHALYQDGRLYRCNRPWLLRIKNCIHGQGTLYRRRLFAEKSYDASLRVYYDYEFNLWALAAGKRFHHTDVVLALLGTGGHSDRPRWKNYIEDMRTRARYLRGPFLVATNIVAVARYLYKVAWFRLQRGL